MEENYNKNEEPKKTEQETQEMKNLNMNAAEGQPQAEKQPFKGKKVTAIILSAVAVFAIGFMGGVVGNTAAGAPHRFPERMTAEAGQEHGQRKSSERPNDENNRKSGDNYQENENRRGQDKLFEDESRPESGQDNQQDGTKRDGRSGLYGRGMPERCPIANAS